MLKRLIAWFLFDQTLNIRMPVEEEKTRLLEIFNSARLSAGCFTEDPLDLAEFSRRINGEVVHVAEIGGQIAGFVSVWEAQAFIHHLYVCPRFQGQGLGKALLQMCERRYGRPLSLKCICANRRALGFYRRNGWISKGSGSGVDGAWERLWLKSTRDEVE
ncbi:GNAT family N-acetyltransferase [Methylomarinum sp. Ch1-1]|uniref:GNAT family N-acetyltransferase n=1 Tax=Methylomarinum roseum TaxID=3067653 RepID=A0AAU7NUV3_9GAMM|nr:GNAT family N-acetyltransferase [Methylomarinum sp. Ch1-1]MDP4519147.1 GNAT family N-acetyltransferase [Methylomarinum sp. Ch1-1]